MKGSYFDICGNPQKFVSFEGDVTVEGGRITGELRDQDSGRVALISGTIDGGKMEFRKEYPDRPGYIFGYELRQERPNGIWLGSHDSGASSRWEVMFVGEPTFGFVALFLIEHK